MSDDLHCHGCGYPVHTSIENACPWCRSNAKEIARLRTKNEHLEAKLAKAVEALEKLNVGEGWAAQIARTALVEIKGEDRG